VYSFDPVGSFEREPYRAGGSGASLIQPFLDNQVIPAMVAVVCSTVLIRSDGRTLSGIGLS
jgi:20S proteasome alpha/beta subunit